MPRPRALIVARFWGVIPIVLAIGVFATRACVHVAPADRLVQVASLPDDPSGSRALAGTLDIARGGPVIIGFQSPGPARLTIASRDIRGVGVIKERIIFEAGPLPFRFAGPPDARLVWSPVGRRGDPEYIPASSLSPDPPERATFTHPGTAISDGVFALLLLCILVGSLLMLVRERLARVPRGVWIALGATFTLALIARLFDLGGGGQTWDEDVNWASGRNYVTNLLSLDFSEPSWVWNFEHPPVMKLLDGIGAQFADGMWPARALSAIWCSLGCALLVPIGARLFRLRVGVLAAVTSALLPPLVAHGQIVGHESPTVLWWSLGILISLGVHDELPDDPRQALRRVIVRMVAVGAVVGIAIASRFVNGLLGPLCALIVLVRAPAAWRTRTTWWSWVMVAAAVIVFLAVWPRMWHHPIANLELSLAKLRGLHAVEPFLGAVTNHPAGYYFLVYLYATAPLGVLLAVASGVARCAVERTRSTLLLAAWLLIPLGVAASPVRQDGVRYVMPCLLALAMLAAFGLDWLATKLETRVKHLFPGLVAAVALYLGLTLARVHPYYLDYFGEQVGGAGGVQSAKLVETAWWGEGLDRAVAYVNAHAEPFALVTKDCILPGHLAWFREDLWTTAQNPNVADYIVWYAPASQACHIPKDAREVFSVVGDGAVFARVYARP